VLKRLDLPYRVMLLCAGDMGAAARKTTTSMSGCRAKGLSRDFELLQCGEYQARRMNAPLPAEREQKPRFVHTLNGSGLAVGRTLIAVLENHQQADARSPFRRLCVPTSEGSRC